MTDIMLDLLVQTMKDVSVMKIKGSQKKRLVIELLMDELDMPEIVEDLLENLIDILIQTENGKIVFNKKIKTSLLNCYSSRK